MVQARTEQYKPVAYLKNPHGVHGEIEATGNEDTRYFFEHQNVYWVTDKHNMLIPVRIKSYRTIDSTDDFMFFVQFENIDNRDAVYALSGCTLYIYKRDIADLAEAEVDVPEETKAAKLIGYTVYNRKSEEEGRVDDIMVSPAHDIIILDEGLMIPVINEYIISVDHNDEVIHCRNVDQLKEL